MAVLCSSKTTCRLKMSNTDSVLGKTEIFLIFVKCCSIVAAVVGNGLVVASILSRKKTREKKNSKLVK